MKIKNIPLFVVGLFSLCLLGQASEDYKFKDEDGNEIAYPRRFPIYSLAQPGPWNIEEAKLHEPFLKWRWRKEGLESIRLLRIAIPHPTEDPSFGAIRTLTAFDKDKLPVAFNETTEGLKKIEVEFRINGVINYVEVLVSCSKHGLWKKEFKLDASNSEDRTTKLN